MPPFNHNGVFPAGCNEGLTVQNHNYEPQMFSPAPRSHSSHGASEGANTARIFPHDTLFQRNDLPVKGTYHFESELPFPVRAQNENSNEISFLPQPLGEGSSRYGVGASSPTPRTELNPPSNRYEFNYTPLPHDVNTQDGAGPSGSEIIALVSNSTLK